MHITRAFLEHFKKFAEAGRVKHNLCIGLTDSEPGDVGNTFGRLFWKMPSDDKDKVNRSVF